MYLIFLYGASGVKLTWECISNEIHASDEEQHVVNFQHCCNPVPLIKIYCSLPYWSCTVYIEVIH